MKKIRCSLGKTLHDKLTLDQLNVFMQVKLSGRLSLKYTADIAGVIKSVCRFTKKLFDYEDKSEFILIPKGQSEEKELVRKDEQSILNRYLTANPTASNIGILLSSATDIRICELCALKWSDIDLNKRFFDRHKYC